MTITFAYDVEKKRIIYQTEEHEKLFSNLTPLAVLTIFRILKFGKEKNLYPNINFKKKLNFFEFES